MSRLLDDLVIVSDGPPTGYPESAEIVEVPEDGVVSIQDADVYVKIDNVPDNMSVYLHTNLLMFGTRKILLYITFLKSFPPLLEHIATPPREQSLLTYHILSTSSIHLFL